MSAVTDEITLISPKSLGEFKAVKSLNTSLDLLASGELDWKEAYSLLSMELDRMAGKTKIDPSSLLKAVLSTEDGRKLYSRCEKKTLKRRVYGQEKNMLDSLIKTAFLVDVLGDIINEAQGETNALGLASSKFMIGQDAISLKKTDAIVCVVISSPEGFTEALRFNRNVLGLTSDNIYAVAMIATTGLMVGARNEIGNLVGVGEFVHDRDESFHVHSLCVAPGWEGCQISRSILEKAVSLHPKKRFWATVDPNNIQAAVDYLALGFRATGYVRDYFKVGADRLYLERNPATNKPHEAEEMAYGKTLDYADLLNTKGYSIVSINGSPGQETLHMVKDGEKHGYRGCGRELGEIAPGVKAYVLDDPGGIADVVKLERWSFGAAAEQPHILARIMRTGCLIVVKSADGRLYAELAVVFDTGDGLFCHGIAVAKGLDEVEYRVKVMTVVEDLAAKYGRKRVWTTVHPLKRPFMEANMNRLGYVGTKMLLDYYGIGDHRMVVEKTVGTPPKHVPDPRALSLIKDRNQMAAAGDAESVLLQATDYALLKKYLDQGYNASKMVSAEEYGRPDENTHGRPLFVLEKTHDVAVGSGKTKP